MSLTLRRIIFYCATIIFLITAPLIIGYTAGYRYHFRQHRIVKTGGIFIATDPKDAVITINDEARTEITPASILNLSPGEYRIRVSKNGYYPWEKKLSVESERLTFADNILLLRNQEPHLVQQGDITDAAIVPRDGTILYRLGDSTLNEVWMLREQTNASLLWRGSGETRTIADMNRSGTILLTDGNKHAPIMIVPDKNAVPLDFGQLINPPLTRTRFDTNDQNIIYGLNKGTLHSIHTKTRIVRPVAANLLDYLQTKDGMMLLIDKAVPELVRMSGTTTTKIATLEAGATELFDLVGGLGSFWKKTTNETVLFDVKKPDLVSATRVPGKIIAAITAHDDLSIVSATDHEIWRTVVRSGRAELITRVSDQIMHTYLHPSGGIIVYVTPDRIRAIELDDRDARTMYDVAAFDHIDETTLARDGSYLLIAGTREKTRGLWRRDIR